jgi:DNA-binding LacI/PurR family transcriptional regulator
MMLAVNHLLKAGRRRRGYLKLVNTTYSHHKHQEGFEQAINNAGIELDPDKQITTLRDNAPDMMAAISQMLQTNPEVDGLVCFHSGIAAVALKACARLGCRVPDDIAIIGYDDIFLADLTTPSLTTLDLTIPKEEVGAMAARMLLDQITKNNTRHDDVMLEHKLIIRDSAP